MKIFSAGMFIVAALSASCIAPATADTVGPKIDRAKDPGLDQQIMAAQQALKDKGHDPGKMDGKMGPRTRAMLADYQKAEGLKVTGQLDNDTRGKLGI